ncbi:MAG: peptidylprolyl isomerase [Ferruginibacter sp.]
MKKYYLIVAIATANYTASAQTFITYGTNNISKQEFLKAYNKNKTPADNTEKAVREYIYLYSNFKLKVKAAAELGIDTLPQIQYDISNFREQIMENYLNDEKVIDQLLQETFSRVKTDRRVLHFSIPVAVDASVADTQQAWAVAKELHIQLKKGNTDYNEIIAKAGPSIIKQRDLGFITAFTLPYQYENIVYGLNKNEVSAPYRSKTAWHLFKLLEVRPSAGRWRIAQVLIAISPDADEARKAAAQSRANEAMGKINSVVPFAEVAKTYSDDKLTYLNGGEMPEFGTGTFTNEFESQVFNLKKDGDISQPFLTSFGYHIVKRMGFTPTPEIADEAYLFDLKQKLMRDERVNTEKEKFTRDLIEKVDVKELKEVKPADLSRYADSAITNTALKQTLVYPISNKNVLKVKNELVKGSDWLAFVQQYKTNLSEYKGETNSQLWNKFVEITALNYYKKNLESYNQDFDFQMQEFKEGNMLFEIMERNVWGKAISDSAGLKEYYQYNASKFRWAESADVLIFNCNAPKVAEEAIIALKKGKNWRALAADQSAVMQADSGRYEIAQIIGANFASTPKKGNFSAITSNIDGTSTFVMYVNVYPPNQQRSFDEARGLVINEYQQVLEKNWIEELRKKYPVKVKEAMIKEMY